MKGRVTSVDCAEDVHGKEDSEMVVEIHGDKKKNRFRRP